MPLRTLLLIAGVIALVFGLGFLLVPRALLGLYGVSADPVVVLMSRLFGAALLQLGLVLYLIRDVGDLRTKRGVVIGSFIGSVAGFVVTLTGSSGARQPVRLVQRSHLRSSHAGLRLLHVWDAGVDLTSR